MALPTSTPDHASPTYLPALDGLRGVSIVFVVASHFGLHAFFPGGYGVTLFFFISGFIITRLLIGEAERESPRAISRFYLRRFFRLVPALVVFVVVCNIALAARGWSLPAADTAAALFYYANYWQLLHGWTPPAPESPSSPYVVLWSLAVEEHFYLGFPLLLFAFRRRWMRLAYVLVALCAAVLLWRCVLVFGVAWPDDGRATEHLLRASDARLDAILYGATLALWDRVARNSAQAASALRAVARPWVVAVAVVLTVVGLPIRELEYRGTVRSTIEGLALLAMFAYLFCGAGGAWLRRELARGWIVHLGRISYSLYLYHALVLVMLAPHVARHGPVMYAVAGVPASLLLAQWSWRYVETPLRALGHRLSEPASREVPAPARSPVG